MNTSRTPDDSAFDFRPHSWLVNPHLQSVLASSGVRRRLFSRYAILERTSTEHILDCGEGVRLQGFHTSSPVRDRNRGLVVLLHGWEGSARSAYMLHTGERLLKEGFDVFRLNFRDHGYTHHLNPELFHSCRIDEVVGAIKAVAKQFPIQPFVIVGFSLGGNFALRVALRAPSQHIPLSYALAVSPLINPAQGLCSLEHAPWFYQRYFLLKWRASLKRKQALFPERELFNRADLNNNLRELTRLLVQRHTEFKSLENYLDGYSIAGDRLAALRIPAAILTARDDPVIPVADFEQLVLPPQLELNIVAHGGHCGFIRDFSLSSFSEDYIVERLLQKLGNA